MAVQCEQLRFIFKIHNYVQLTCLKSDNLTCPVLNFLLESPTHTEPKIVFTIVFNSNFCLACLSLVVL